MRRTWIPDTMESLQILVVNDNEAVPEAFGITPERFAVKVAIAGGGGEAPQELCKGNGGLAILDLNLPDPPRLCVLEWLRARATTAPGLVVTGMEERPDVCADLPSPPHPGKEANLE